MDHKNWFKVYYQVVSKNWNDKEINNLIAYLVNLSL